MSGGDDFDLEAMERRRQRAQLRTESLRNERRGSQRAAMRRKIRRRRAIALGSIAVVVTVAAGAWTSLGGNGEPRVPVDRTSAQSKQAPQVVLPKLPKTGDHIPMPKVVRGIHVSLGIAANKAKMHQFMDLTAKGLNTLEIDVKDENGEVGFTTGAPALAKKIGAARNYYNARQLVQEGHAAGIYMIARVVCFEDPIMSHARPAHAIRTTSGGVWENASGLGWTNEYDPYIWNYLMSVSKAAANMGFDEIQFDYVRFPTDGNTANAIWPHKVNEPFSNTIYRFLKKARATLHPLGVNISANVFGLSAHSDLGIGQDPSKIAPLLDAISPMAYPSHYGPNEYNLADPDTEPGATVTYTMGDFRAALQKTHTVIRPWLQDFSLGHTYTLADVEAQTTAAERGGAGGWLLWNADDVYHTAALGD